jgi:membrane-bound lytic murein transglycosylase A
VRNLCFIVLLFAGAFSVHAQSVKPNRIEAIADKDYQSGKMRTIIGPGVAAGIVPPVEAFKPVGPPAAVPDRDTIEFAVQLLPHPFSISNTQLETISWTKISGWAEDDHIAAFATFLNSCKAIVRGTPPRHAGQPFYAALQSACRRALKAPPRDSAAAQIFFERNFRPMRIAPLGENNGFLTGYYEPIIEGSRVPSAEFNVPLYRKPADLGDHESSTYHDRSAIEEGALAGRKLEICWLKDPTDLFFAQIQGSARVRIEDGKVLRLNYNGHNGWPYTPIGRILIAREIVLREEMSMDRIREWIQANPKEGKELRRRNKSYVFFRETSLSEHEEPVGAQGVSLTPGRSIATDKSIHIYGTPFFIEAELPLESERSENNFQRLMVSQDTGSAIRGSARADLYFGSAEASASVAGRIRHVGQFTILIPREIDPVIAGRSTPLPRPRPAFDNIEEKPGTSSEKPAFDQKKEVNAGRELDQTQ